MSWNCGTSEPRSRRAIRKARSRLAGSLRTAGEQAREVVGEHRRAAVAGVERLVERERAVEVARRPRMRPALAKSSAPSPGAAASPASSAASASARRPWPARKRGIGLVRRRQAGGVGDHRAVARLGGGRVAPQPRRARPAAAGRAGSPGLGQHAVEIGLGRRRGRPPRRWRAPAPPWRAGVAVAGQRPRAAPTVSAVRPWACRLAASSARRRSARASGSSCRRSSFATWAARAQSPRARWIRPSISQQLAVVGGAAQRVDHHALGRAGAAVLHQEAGVAQRSRPAPGRRPRPRGPAARRRARGCRRARAPAP